MTRRTVLVTGTSTGIGRATALHLCSCGFDVLAGVRREVDAESVRALSPEHITPLILDVTEPAQVATAAERAAATGLFGLVNNAGVTVQGPVEFLDLDALRSQLEVNLVGQVAMTQAVLPLLRASRGRIVMVSSVGGRFATPFIAPYHASKYALEGLSDALRQELRPLGVGVSIVEPGTIKTEIWRKGAETGREVVAALPPEARRLYGSRIESLLKTVPKIAQRGIEPVEVAEAIAHALTASRPKPRYLVGADARVQMVLKAALPTRVLDAIVARSTGTR
jgi:NAD(P)-dependent dehydrogenase (short-subunit alcohol dehydrogenase family)